MRELTEKLMSQLSSRFGGRALAIDDMALMQHASKAAMFGFSIEGPQGVTVENHDGVAVFHVDGVMVPQAEWPDEVSTELLAEAIDKAAADESIHSGVLLINSPGGMVQGQGKLLESARAFAKSKPLIAHADGLCCSAGYWLATAASKIYATAGTAIGSIGVFHHLLDYSRMFENAGIKSIAIKTGALKGIGLMGEPVTDEHQAHVQEGVDFVFAVFSGAVSSSRSITGGKLSEVANGGSWYVEQANAAALHDGVHELSETLLGMSRGTLSRTSSKTKEAAMADQNTNTPVEPTFASTAVLKKTFPNSSAEWREEQTEAEATLAEAAVAYAQFQEQVATDAQAERDAANERAEKAEEAEAKSPEKTKSRRGVASAKHNPGDDEQSHGEVDYAAMARDIAKEENMLYREAAQVVMRNHPEAHAAFSQSNARAKYHKHFNKA